MTGPPDQLVACAPVAAGQVGKPYGRAGPEQPRSGAGGSPTRWSSNIPAATSSPGPRGARADRRLPRRFLPRQGLRANPQPVPDNLSASVRAASSALRAPPATLRFGSAGLLERLAVPPAQLGDVLAGLHAAPSIDELVVLSTCNRVEVYAATSG
ncbi:MAG: hypothetical protein ACR2MP_30520, partial [Streptosporangiaceae bacterium]